MSALLDHVFQYAPDSGLSKKMEALDRRAAAANSDSRRLSAYTQRWLAHSLETCARVNYFESINKFYSPESFDSSLQNSGLAKNSVEHAPKLFSHVRLPWAIPLSEKDIVGLTAIAESIFKPSMKSTKQSSIEDVIRTRILPPSYGGTLAGWRRAANGLLKNNYSRIIEAYEEGKSNPAYPLHDHVMKITRENIDYFLALCANAIYIEIGPGKGELLKYLAEQAHERGYHLPTMAIYLEQAKAWNDPGMPVHWSNCDMYGKEFREILMHFTNECSRYCREAGISTPPLVFMIRGGTQLNVLQHQRWEFYQTLADACPPGAIAYLVRDNIWTQTLKETQSGYEGFKKFDWLSTMALLVQYGVHLDLSDATYGVKLAPNQKQLIEPESGEIVYHLVTSFPKFRFLAPYDPSTVKPSQRFKTNGCPANGDSWHIWGGDLTHEILARPGPYERVKAGRIGWNDDMVFHGVPAVDTSVSFLMPRAGLTFPQAHIG